MNSWMIGQSKLDLVGVTDWHPMAFLCIVMGIVGYWLLQAGLVRSRTMATLGCVLIAAASLLAGSTQKLNLDGMILFSFFALAVGGGLAFLTVRQPVYAALGFATAILSGAGVLFTQSALFIAAATMIVYAGATIIIFLFVLMFSQQPNLVPYELRLNSPLLVGLIAIVFLGSLVVALQSVEKLDFGSQEAIASRPMSQETKLDKPSNTAALGRGMFTDYLMTVELAGTLLLVATVGAIVVAQRTLEPEA